MPIKYTIRENKLTSSTTFNGRVLEFTTFNKDKLIEDILGSGTTVTKPDIEAVVTTLINAVLKRLLDGGRVNLDGLIQIFPSIEGVFTGTSDDYEPSRHRLHLNAIVSEQLKKDFRAKAVIEKDLTPPRTPIIYEVIDTNPGNTNLTLTQNKIIHINGEYLKFDTPQADEGLFFINDTTPAETKQPNNDISTMTDGKLMFIPTVTGIAGDSCHLEVRTRMGNSATYPLKTAVSVPLTMGWIAVAKMGFGRGRFGKGSFGTKRT